MPRFFKTLLRTFLFLLVLIPILWMGTCTYIFAYRTPPGAEPEKPWSRDPFASRYTDDPTPRQIEVGGQTFIVPRNQLWYHGPVPDDEPNMIMGHGALPDFAPFTEENWHLFDEDHFQDHTGKLSVRGHVSHKLKPFGVWDKAMHSDFISNHCKEEHLGYKRCDPLYGTPRKEAFIDVEKQLFIECNIGSPTPPPHAWCSVETPLIAYIKGNEIGHVKLEIYINRAHLARANELRAAATKRVCAMWQRRPDEKIAYDGCKVFEEMGRYSVPPPSARAQAFGN